MRQDYAAMLPTSFYESWVDEQANDANSLLLHGFAALWDEPLSYVRQYTQALGSVIEGYFVSYFSQKCMPDEWLPLNSHIVWQEAGLTDKQWRSVRNKLIEKGLLLNRRTVFPTGSLFTLNDQMLENMVRERADTGISAIAVPPVSINKLHLQTLSALDCSIKSVLYLSFLQNETEYQAIEERGDWSLWTCVAEQYVHEHCCLSRREQESAIRELSNLGLIECRLEGTPATRYARYSLKRLGELSTAFLNGGL